MPDETLGLLLLNEVPAAQTVEILHALRVDIVQPVVVEITGAGSAKLLLKEPFAVFLLLEHIGGELGGEGKAVARMTGDQRLLRRFLTLAAAVHPGSVKVGEALFQEAVYHLLHLLHVDAAVVVGVQQRQPHQAEAEFLFTHSISSFFRLLSGLLHEFSFLDL